MEVLGCFLKHCNSEKKYISVESVSSFHEDWRIEQLNIQRTGRECADIEQKSVSPKLVLMFSRASYNQAGTCEVWPSLTCLVVSKDGGC